MGHPEVKWSMVSSCCLHILLLLFVITFLTQNLQLCAVPQSNHVSRAYSVAAVLQLQFMLNVISHDERCVLLHQYFYGVGVQYPLWLFAAVL